MDRASDYIQAFPFHDKYMLCFHENGENIHFFKCHQSLTIISSLGERNGVALQNCGYCYIVLFTVNLAQYW